MKLSLICFGRSSASCSSVVKLGSGCDCDEDSAWESRSGEEEESQGTEKERMASGEGRLAVDEEDSEDV